jgi:hypothetical protein
MLAHRPRNRLQKQLVMTESFFRGTIYFIRVNTTLHPARLGHVSANVCHLQVGLQLTIIRADKRFEVLKAVDMKIVILWDIV